MDRRQFIAATGAAALTTQLPLAANGIPARQSELIRQENAQPGSTDWQLTRVRTDAPGFRSPWVEGYC